MIWVPLETDCAPLRYYAAEWHRKSELCPRYLTEDQAKDLLTVCDSCLTSYAILSNMAVECGELLFPIRPKLHVTELNSQVSFGLAAIKWGKLSYIPGIPNTRSGGDSQTFAWEVITWL